MSEFSRETLLNIIETDHVQCGDASALARMALAAMDSDPVAYMHDGEDGTEYNGHNEFSGGGKGIPLYRHAQPAPVVPELRVDWQENEFSAGWNACRAAMLQELKKSAGTEAICRSDENVQVLHTKSPAQSDCCPAQNSVTPAQGGNSLVIPDEMTSGQAYEIGYYYGDPVDVFARGANWMRQHIIDSTLAAAPQLPGSDPATVPGKWIPVSERMPDDDDFVYIWPRPDFGVELHVGQYCECSPKGDGWYAQVYEQNYGIEWHPITVTHWMPLPAAPQEVKSES